MIKTKQLTYQYQPNEQVFSFPNIDISDQDDLLIVGKSGIGKTTLLHLLAGILKPIDGTITIENTNINDLKSNNLDKFRGHNIGLVFQNNHAITSLSVYDNLKARLFLSKQDIDTSKIDGLLQDLGLIEFKHRKTNALSEGQLQRLGIALAVIHGPKVIFADEPTSSLDDENCRIVIELLKDQANMNNANLVVITHDHRVKPYFEKSITL
ncbi:ABC transporter ATP-binding protein [Psychroserpens sp.]|uniref:ABC transporter ATP-binding protein n=1 Tax=Psychroserpens sp. TaxID=2020870 RepID=UPI001AFD3524|nr:ATP-binding cassette domain-containing protein [Psychroserpens sp.]MBO6607637.1 ATP-binding cassette domain-containing protein [Psychroserpens sp.]MBO6631420.1 ATP-binding cassette domain-containing protein [Psychroserpens sp.]MBO6655051.1 ATP-binding cassette domain-containing protein [Psychroserpens sp.]MBO6683144.1 ATP-binding cassette domain-containing protein [Psychroserpens sp.]MBO6749677.1 ATP-binding cassette domain-containing protein [Psychroserpens sp.]